MAQPGVASQPWGGQVWVAGRPWISSAGTTPIHLVVLMESPWSPEAFPSFYFPFILAALHYFGHTALQFFVSLLISWVAQISNLPWHCIRTFLNSKNKANKICSTDPLLQSSKVFIMIYQRRIIYKSLDKMIICGSGSSHTWNYAHFQTTHRKNLCIH